MAANKSYVEAIGFDIGDKVLVNGSIFGNGHGTGTAVDRFDATMYVVGLADPDKYEYPVAVANTKSGRRQGWASPDAMKKIGVVTVRPKDEVKGTAKPTSGTSSLIGRYCTTRNIWMRSDAGSHSDRLTSLPAGQVVECLLGQYTPFMGIKWLYVETVYRGVKYIGFCSGNYLSRIDK